METAKRVGFVLILVLLTAGAAQSAEGPAKISYTRTASCLVKITSDPAVLPLSFESIDYLLHSSGVGGKAARQVLDLSPDQVQDLFYMQELASDDGAPPSPSPAALSRIEKSGLNEESVQYDEMMAEIGRSETSAAAGSPSLPRSTTPTVPTPMVRPTVRSGSSRTGSTSSATRRTVTPSSPPLAAEQTYLFSLNIQLPEEVKPAAEEFMDALIYSLRDAITRTFDEHSNRLAGQLKIADEEAARAEEDLRQKQAELRSICGSNVLDRDKILADISLLRGDIQRTKMDQASGQIIVDATTTRIAEIQDKLKEQIENDTVAKELADLLALQVANCANVEKLYKAGRASTTELADAQEKLARAKIELAQRSEQLSKSKGGDLIDSLNKTLADRSVGIAQYQAHLSSYERQLSEAEELLGKTDDYELLSLKADIAKQNLQEVILWRDRISRQVRMLQPPTVSVIGGD